MSTLDPTPPREYACCDHCLIPSTKGPHRHLTPCTECGTRHDAPRSEIDPEIVCRHVRGIREAMHAVTASKYWLASYLSSNAPSECQYGVTERDDRAGHFDCTLEVDGFVLISCGHHVFTCRTGGSRIMAEAASQRVTLCTKTDGLHDGQEPIVTLEWVGLA